MRLSAQARTALFVAALGLMFVIGAGVTACVVSPGRHPSTQRSLSPAPAPSLVLGYALAHPDPAISGPFADKLRSGEIKIIIEKPKEHAMASFGPREGGYALTIDPARLKPKPTLEEYEGTLSILSHEHAHYRQYVEGEMTNYYPRGGPMTEAQCTLTILVEIDAHGKACRDARAYGWETGVAKSACERTTVSLAEYFLRERAATHPECKPVWEFYSARVSGEPVPKAKTRSAKPPKKRAAPIYMPPP